MTTNKLLNEAANALKDNNRRLREELRKTRLCLDLLARQHERLDNLLFDLSSRMTPEEHARWRGHTKDGAA